MNIHDDEEQRASVYSSDGSYISETYANSQFLTLNHLRCSCIFQFFDDLVSKIYIYIYVF